MGQLAECYNEATGKALADIYMEVAMSMIDGADAKTRKSFPITTGVLDYFPDALLEVAALSKVGNDQHNPGQPLHWSKDKSSDHADTLVRHMLDRGKRDNDGVRHSAKVAWRALALLQTEIECERKAADLKTDPPKFDE